MALSGDTHALTLHHKKTRRAAIDRYMQAAPIIRDGITHVSTGASCVSVSSLLLSRRARGGWSYHG
ncbi:hypothetical protein OPIT5_14665 [Opitutaceae bacterium TAV5]|nr:hypothetical protein OPIT5_14665 [Opitutaceae bacterium TAV5]